MTARLLQVAFVNASCAYLRGHGSRELLTELRGRPPVYGTRVRAWHTQPHTARDALAVAESRGWRTEVITEEHLLRLAGVEVAEERGVLW